MYMCIAISLYAPHYVHVGIQPGDIGPLVRCRSGQSTGHTAQEAVQECPLLCLLPSWRPALVSTTIYMYMYSNTFVHNNVYMYTYMYLLDGNWIKVSHYSSYSYMYLCVLAMCI